MSKLSLDHLRFAYKKALDEWVTPFAKKKTWRLPTPQ